MRFKVHSGARRVGSNAFHGKSGIGYARSARPLIPSSVTHPNNPNAPRRKERENMDTPKTGHACTCKCGVQRDNCSNCEGTGRAIDWRAFHAAKPSTPAPTNAPERSVDEYSTAFDAEGR